MGGVPCARLSSKTYWAALVGQGLYSLASSTMNVYSKSPWLMPFSEASAFPCPKLHCQVVWNVVDWLLSNSRFLTISYLDRTHCWYRLFACLRDASTSNASSQKRTRCMATSVDLARNIVGVQTPVRTRYPDPTRSESWHLVPYDQRKCCLRS